MGRPPVRIADTRTASVIQSPRQGLPDGRKSTPAPFMAGMNALRRRRNSGAGQVPWTQSGIVMTKWQNVKKVVLAYSGGLDTSIILKWLQTELDAEVVTFTADLGQGDSDLEPARRKAEMMGAKEIYIEDVREEFVRDFVFPMFRANALYEGCLLYTSDAADE